MSLTNKILIDADGIIASTNDDDPNHKRANIVYDIIYKENYKKYMTNLVFAEIATVFSRKTSQYQAIKFLQKFPSSDIELIYLDEYLTQKTIDLFIQQKKKRTSFVDCANLVVMREHGIAKIFSFDSFYKDKRFIV